MHCPDCLMADATAVRTTLLQTENTLPSIQNASRSMMSLYDRPSGAAVAVSEWRQVLQTCRASQMLPLLYVANEVLQTSKRNRGNKFLEAFSPVLGSSLIYICQKDKTLVEKVRRTVKIWGDRRIFSMRFVMDVLAGLDSFRGETSGVEGKRSSITQNTAALPLATSSHKPAASPKVTPALNSEEEENEDDLIAGTASGQNLLDVDLKVDTAALSAAVKPKHHPEFGATAKRRRSSVSPILKQKSPASGKAAAKKPKTLSNQSFLEIFQSVINLDGMFKSSLDVLKSIPPSYLEENRTDIDDLVGDELTDMYKKVCESQQNIRKERLIMYHVAVERRQLEEEAKRYVQWLKNLVKVDDDDIDCAERLEQKLDVLSVCYEEAKSLRDTRREEQARRLAEEAAAALREAEEEERRRMLDDVKKQAEAKPGMVWNPQLREYQYLHDPTEESWRD